MPGRHSGNLRLGSAGRAGVRPPGAAAGGILPPPAAGTRAPPPRCSGSLPRPFWSRLSGGQAGRGGCPNEPSIPRHPQPYPFPAVRAPVNHSHTLHVLCDGARAPGGEVKVLGLRALPLTWWGKGRGEGARRGAKSPRAVDAQTSPTAVSSEVCIQKCRASKAETCTLSRPSSCAKLP